MSVAPSSPPLPLCSRACAVCFPSNTSGGPAGCSDRVLPLGGAAVDRLFLCVLQTHPISSRLIFTRTDTSRFQNPFSQEGNTVLKTGLKSFHFYNLFCKCFCCFSAHDSPETIELEISTDSSDGLILWQGVVSPGPGRHPDARVPPPHLSILVLTHHQRSAVSHGSAHRRPHMTSLLLFVYDGPFVCCLLGMLSWL